MISGFTELYNIELWFYNIGQYWIAKMNFISKLVYFPTSVKLLSLSPGTLSVPLVCLNTGSVVIVLSWLGCTIISVSQTVSLVPYRAQSSELIAEASLCEVQISVWKCRQSCLTESTSFCKVQNIKKWQKLSLIEKYKSVTISDVSS